MHSYYSDGRASPAELLHHAASLGLKTVAITDHDTVRGLPEAGHVADGLGLELIPAVELTTRWDSCPPPPGEDGDRDVDLLGYFIDQESRALQAFLEAAFQDLQARILACCQGLSAAGYPVSLAEVQAENPRYPGAIQLVTVLWRKKHAASWNEAVRLFAGHWREAPPARHTIGDAIGAIHAAGGAAVLAHPVAVRCAEGLLPRERLSELAGWGLDGIEVYHPRLDANARSHFLRLAHELNLAVSGGSDEHGWRSGFSRMGSELITYEMVNGLRARAERQRA
jgi:predicted metal-dependent phosphoesterase TrpH